MRMHKRMQNEKLEILFEFSPTAVQIQSAQITRGKWNGVFIANT